jgi:transcriptional regulator with GAF, ATPase, and Fis domain
MAQLEEQPAEAMLLDHWLPDLEVGEFAEQVCTMYPEIELLRMDGDLIKGGSKSPRRHELLHAVRQAVSDTQTEIVDSEFANYAAVEGRNAWDTPPFAATTPPLIVSHPLAKGADRRLATSPSSGLLSNMIVEMVGRSAEMLELARMVRLVAPRTSTVLIEGETGTGKEVVARALHRLSPRSAKPFVILNCAAIPESLLEAELFGHTRGAFTGAVQSRTGRIEAAHGGSLFLDEIGEMPLALQAKMLRFLESGELQRVGDNDVQRVDVRVIAATHQPLEKRAAEGTFRLDLYHRLAVFPLEVPPLRSRCDDIASLSEHFLELMGKTGPKKTLSDDALHELCMHDWPGNVRELAHVLERAAILAEDSPLIRAQDIRIRRASRS